MSHELIQGIMKEVLRRVTFSAPGVMLEGYLHPVKRVQMFNPGMYPAIRKPSV
jgi:hypothetical protein